MGPICATGAGGLIPGYVTGPRKGDCLAEVCSLAPPPPDVNLLHPSNRIICKEGDPACDFGPGGDGICTFKVALCFNVSDTRQQCVLPPKVTRISFVGPAGIYPVKNPIDQDNIDALETATLTLPGSAISTTPRRSVLFTPPLTVTDICSPDLLFKVPLRQTRLGYLTGRKALRYRVYPNPEFVGPDRDAVRFRCTP